MFRQFRNVVIGCVVALSEEISISNRSQTTVNQLLAGTVRHDSTYYFFCFTAPTSFFKQSWAIAQL